MKSKPKPTVIDFFCGAGGFSEGFRQQGFEIVRGVDNWRPAIETHNLNHHLNDAPKDVLDFGESIEEIEKLPDTDVIVGSPPCVLFSMSNKAGKADKTLGIRLIEAYLRVIAVKKYKKNSKLKAWFLENVPNSRKYVKASYTFRDLNLVDWAKERKLKPDAIALEVSENSTILNAAHYGAPQKRERFVCGEIIDTGSFMMPEKTHDVARTLKEVRSGLPQPNSSPSRKIWHDPNYIGLRIAANEITDHFYDTGIYEMYWRNARDYKLNHPYMGKMSFPEDENNPSRTIMATKSASSRESLIYPSEYGRTGNGQYRLPTIREISCLMGFPLSYQFFGGEATKWEQIGNAVPPFLSSALAKTVRIALGLKPIHTDKIDSTSLRGNEGKVLNLNTYSERKFDKPPKRKSLSRFRRHPFKIGNMTVALTNYNPAGEIKRGGERWYSAVFYSTGKDYAVEVLEPRDFKRLEKIIISNKGLKGKQFISEFDKRFQSALENVDLFQQTYENPARSAAAFNPTSLIDDLAKFISRHDPQAEHVRSRRKLAGRNIIPVRQLYAMYAINKLISQQK
jgi:DNA (cytosine-5)-methyltransferase 1